MSEEIQRANRLLAAGQLNEASAIFAQVVQQTPTNGDAWLGLGRIALALKQPAKAVELLMQGLKVSPNSVEHFAELGKALLETGNFKGAKMAFESGLKRVPQDLGMLLGLGDACAKSGLHSEAITTLKTAVAAHPQHPAPLNNLGNVLKQSRQFEEALAAFDRAVAVTPTIAQVHSNRAAVLLELRRNEDAIESAQRAIALNPQMPEAWFVIGNASRMLYRTGDSMTAFERTLSLNPQHLGALINLGNALKDQGRIAEALDYYRRAVAVDPKFFPAHENVLSTLHYDPSSGLPEIYRAHAEWDERFTQPLKAHWLPFENDRSPERRIRIGLYSNNLGNHPVGYFVRAAFEAIDREQFELVVYSSRVTDDAQRDRFRDSASEWHEVARLSDEQLAEKIYDDRIDILIDLAGRLAGGRPVMLALKPAPILINWIGYTGTLGLCAVDYILADRHHIPPEAEPFYAEKVLRLPDGHMCFEPPADAPEVSPLPALDRGFVTFGSFNNPGKVNAEVVAVWAEILQRVPNSRLVLKYRNFDDAATRAHFEKQFASFGVTADRLTFEGVTPFNEMLRRYHDIDIALDPFPFTGGMTTCLALWMGCPVVTWPRDTFASRQSLSYLTTIGLPEFVAIGRNDYIERAVKLANDLPALASLRGRIRPLMAASPFCDRIRFVRNLESVLRGVWRQWCEST